MYSMICLFTIGLHCSELVVLGLVVLGLVLVGLFNFSLSRLSFCPFFSARRPYAVRISGAMPTSQNKICPISWGFFSPDSYVSIVIYVVSKLMLKMVRFNGKTVRYLV